MVWVHTLYQGHSLTEDSDIALDDTLNHLGSRQLTTTETASLQIGINDRRLFHTAIYLKACKL
jgi:hypothetical protein